MSMMQKSSVHRKVITELQSKATVWYYYTQTPTGPNSGKDVEQQELSLTVFTVQMVRAQWKTVWQYLIKLNQLLP